MKFFFTLLILCSLTACGRGAVTPEIDQGEFRSYVERFEATARSSGVDLAGRAFRLSIVFGAPAAGNSATCYSSLLDREIVVSAEAWAERDELGRWLLLSHELGHCVLDRGHVDYESLMNAAAPPTGSEYEANRTAYNYELFHQK